jgi:hypothetical protein
MIEVLAVAATGGVGALVGGGIGVVVGDGTGGGDFDLGPMLYGMVGMGVGAFVGCLVGVALWT